MAVPNTFATATSAIPLANLDANFAYYDGAFSISGTATTFAGSVTLTSGTAYGVAYLNGSKVLTSGSALTFDGTTLGIYNGTGDAQRLNLGTSGTNTVIQATRSSGTVPNMIFQIDASEKMRLTTTGLGIGTSSPLSALHVAGAAFGATTTARIESTSTSNSGSPSIIFLRSSSAVMSSQGIGTIYFTRLLTDASSNTAASIVVTGNNSSSAPTCTINYDAITAQVWKINSTESMRLDSSNNLGIGTSSPATRLQVNKSSQTAGGTTPSGALVISNTVAGNGCLEIGVDSSANGWIQSRNSTSASFYDLLLNPSGGNVGIGTTSPGYKLDVNGAVSVSGITSGTGNKIYFDTTGAAGANTIGTVNDYDLRLECGRGSTSQIYVSTDSVKFNVAAAERMRIDSSGYLLINTTTTVGGAARIGVLFAGNATNGINIQDSTTTSGAVFQQFSNSAGTQIGYIGRVTTTNAVVYSTTSDYRLKEVIGPVSGAGARIDALKPIDYQWKDGNQHARGFLAHEFQEVYADSVTGTKDAVDADGNPKYQAMQAGTAEVIADLVAEIQSLRKRLTALESKEIL